MNKLGNMYRKSEQLILGITGLIFVLLLWQTAAVLKWLNPLMVSSPPSLN